MNKFNRSLDHSSHIWDVAPITESKRTGKYTRGSGLFHVTALDKLLLSQVESKTNWVTYGRLEKPISP